MNKTLSELLTFCSIFVSVGLYSQDIKEIKYDKNALGEVQYPFDTEIPLAIPVNQEIVDPSQIELIELSGPKKKFNDNTVSVSLSGKIERDDNGKTSVLKVVLPPLRPNKHYVLGIATKVHGNELTNLVRAGYILEDIGMGNKDLLKYFKVEEVLLTSQKVFGKNFPYKEDKDFFDAAYMTYSKQMSKAQYDLLEYLISKYKVEQAQELRQKKLLKIDEDNRLGELKHSMRDYVGLSNERINELLEGEIESLNMDVLNEFLSAYLVFAKTYNTNDITSSIFNVKEFAKFISDKSFTYFENEQAIDLAESFRGVLVNNRDCDCLNSFENDDNYKGFVEKINKIILSGSVKSSVFQSSKIINGLVNLEEMDFNSIEGEDSEHKNYFNYMKRISNIKRNIAFLEKSIFMQQMNGLTSNAPVLENLLMTSKEQLKALSEKTSKLQDSHLTSIYKWIDGRTIKEELETEAKGIIIADYGFLFADPGGEIVRPYLGINIGLFGPINKNIRYRYLKQKLIGYNVPYQQRFNAWLRYHLSLTLGVTLWSIQEDNVRDDLFGKNNLIAGVNLRLNRNIRLSSGFLFYEIEDSNPLIDNKKINSNYYVSLSFDISLKKAAQDLSGAIFK